MIENTSRRDPLLHFAGALGGVDRYIGEMESAGQQQVVASTKLPTEGSEDLVALGFTLGEIDPRDPMFREVTLPAGWSKQGSDHAMHSYVVDEHGRKRVNVFYKAAFYDRRADCAVLGLHAYLWTVADGEPLVLDDTWATREAVAAQLASMIQERTEKAAFWRQHGNETYASEREQERARYQQILDGLPTDDGSAVAS